MYLQLIIIIIFFVLITRGVLAPVVQRVYNFTQWINLYPTNKFSSWSTFCVLHSDLSAG